MLELFKRDLDAVLTRDPAARGRAEVILLYPGFHAVVAHRIAHRLWLGGYKFPARALSALTRLLTNVDIHPGAKLGPGFFIDHASGVVIGETAETGEDVTVFHGVTLGGRGFDHGKRHPTLGDRITVGAGAKILGPLYVGDDSRIGANAVVVKDVPSNSVVVGVPGQVVVRSKPRSRHEKPDLDGTVLPDVLGISVQGIQARLDQLEESLSGHVSRNGREASSVGSWRGEDFSI